MTTQITEMMLISTRKFAVRRFGEERWRDVLGKLAEEYRKVFDRELAPSRRFDFPLAADLLATIAATLGGQDGGDEVVHQLGMHNAEDDLNATEKLFMRILTIKLVLKIASFLWTARVKQGGGMTILDRGKTGVGCLIENPPDVSAWWWKYLAGWFHRTIELAGGKDVSSKWTGGGAEKWQTASFEVSWK